MPGRKARYVALRDFSYPKLLSVRDRIRKGSRLTEEERGETQYVALGDKVRPPEDLLGSLIERGLIEEVSDDA